MKRYFKFFTIIMVMSFSIIFNSNYINVSAQSMPLYDGYSIEWFTIMLNDNLQKNKNRTGNLLVSNYKLFTESDVFKKSNPDLVYYSIVMKNRVHDKINCFVGINNSDLVMELIITGPPVNNEMALMQVWDITLACLQTFGFSKDDATKFIKNTLTSNKGYAFVTENNRTYTMATTNSESILGIAIIAME